MRDSPTAGPRLRAALIALDDRGRILALKHVRPNSEYWVLPGGGVETGETVEKGLEREVNEELGIGCRIEKLLAIGELMAPSRHVVDFFFAGTLERHDGFEIRHSEGIGEARWVRPPKLSEMDFRPKEIIPMLEGLSNGTWNAPIYLGKYNYTP